MVFLHKDRREEKEERSGSMRQLSGATGCRAPIRGCWATCNVTAGCRQAGQRTTTTIPRCSPEHPGCFGIAGGGCWCGPEPASLLPARLAGAQPSRRDRPTSQPAPAPTSSSLFKVLEASADVIPAFLDWTRDCGKDRQFPDPAEPGVSLPCSSGLPVAVKHPGRTPHPRRGQPSSQ